MSEYRDRDSYDDDDDLNDLRAHFDNTHTFRTGMASQYDQIGDMPTSYQPNRQSRVLPRLDDVQVQYDRTEANDSRFAAQTEPPGRQTHASTPPSDNVRSEPASPPRGQQQPQFRYHVYSDANGQRPYQSQRSTLSKMKEG